MPMPNEAQLWIVTVIEDGTETRLVFGCEAPAARVYELLRQAGRAHMSRTSWAPERGQAEIERAERLLDFLFGGRDDASPTH